MAARFTLAIMVMSRMETRSSPRSPNNSSATSRIVGVEPASQAVQAGLREGDIIIAFKNQPVASIDQLQRYLGATEIGVTSPITVIRRTEKLELPVTPEEWQPSVRRN